MRQVVLHDLPDFRVTSFGNGLSYEVLHHTRNGDLSVFLQGDDATAFEADLEAMAERWDYSEALARLWEQYGDQAEPIQLHEHTFDLHLFATICVKASSASDARRMLEEALSGADANLGAWPDGSPILAQVSYSRDDACDLVEVDGEEPE